MRNNFFYMGLGGGANSSLHPPFRRRGGAPAPMHPPGTSLSRSTFNIFTKFIKRPLYSIQYTCTVYLYSIQYTCTVYSILVPYTVYLYSIHLIRKSFKGIRKPFWISHCNLCMEGHWKLHLQSFLGILNYSSF